MEENIGTTAQACRAVGLARSSFYLISHVSQESRTLRAEIKTLSQKHPRYGYRRITALLRRKGHEVNGKRVQRVRRMEGLQVSKKQRRMRRVGESTAQRQQATHRGHVWSWDFVEDQTERGTRFRVLTLIDEYSASVWRCMWRGAFARWTSSRWWRPRWKGLACPSICAATTDRSSSRVRSRTG
jgi:putative transposase